MKSMLVFFFLFVLIRLKNRPDALAEYFFLVDTILVCFSNVKLERERRKATSRVEFHSLR